jgi:hypothetical protein
MRRCRHASQLPLSGHKGVGNAAHVKLPPVSGRRFRRFSACCQLPPTGISRGSRGLLLLRARTRRSAARWPPGQPKLSRTVSADRIVRSGPEAAAPGTHSPAETRWCAWLMPHCGIRARARPTRHRRTHTLAPAPPARASLAIRIGTRRSAVRWCIECPAPGLFASGLRCHRHRDRRQLRVWARRLGRVAEWFKAAVLKTAVGASPPWVRIPPLPPAVAPTCFYYCVFLHFVWLALSWALVRVLRRSKLQNFSQPRSWETFRSGSDPIGRHLCVTGVDPRFSGSKNLASLITAKKLPSTPLTLPCAFWRLRRHRHQIAEAGRALAAEPRRL